MMTATPSQYQLAIYQFVQQALASKAARRNLIISAVAGSGKSTTIKELLRFIPSSMTVLYLTFMKEVNLDLGDKVTAMVAQLNGEAPKAEVRTCHSVGNGCLKDLGIKGDPMKNGRKYNHLCQEYLKLHMEEYDYKVSESLADLVNKVRVTLADTSETSLLSIIDRYGIDLDTSDEEVWPIVLKAVPFILEAGVKLAKEKIDFTDQIWLASSKAMNLQPYRYDVVMIDEAQDLSPAIRELALKAAKKDGMIISVGDRRQAIMAFAGASAHSLDELKVATNAVELPLNKNYRCPKSVIRLAQKYVPEIEAYEAAIEGEVNYIMKSSVATMAQVGDMILSRYNAPLVEMAIDLIKMRKRCIVKGKDLGGNVTEFLKKVTSFFQKKDYRFNPAMLYMDMVKFVGEYQSRMLAVLMQNEEENEGRINKLDDDCATLLALFEGYQEEVEEKGSYNDFVMFIEDFFREHGESKGEVRGEARKHTITLSTGHKAKGLENPNVFILGYDELPSTKAKTAEAQEQEVNLLYVMITRPQAKLYCIVKEPEDYQYEKALTMGIVPEPIFLDADEMVEIAEEIVNLPVIENTPVIVSEAQQTVAVEETTKDTAVEEKPSKRTYGGRKALADEDKRVFFQQTWDVSVRAAFKAYTEKLNAENDNNKYSEADVLEMLVLSNPAFASFFGGSEYEDEYNARQQRAEQRREDYKHRRSTKKVVKDEDNNPDDNGPNGNGGGVPAASSEKQEESVVESAKEEIVIQHPSKIERIAYTCLRPSCKQVWLTDYYNQEGLLYRLDDNGQMILAMNDFPECPYCRNKRQYIKVNHPKMTHSSKRKCDSRCWNARPGSNCTCGCGGIHHATGSGGTANMIGQPLLQTSFHNS